jgi:hypothetical protein
VIGRKALLQLRVFRFGFLQDGDVGVGVCFSITVTERRDLVRRPNREAKNDFRIVQPSLILKKSLLKIDKSFVGDCLNIETASA